MTVKRRVVTEYDVVTIKNLGINTTLYSDDGYLGIEVDWSGMLTSLKVVHQNWHLI